MQELINTIRDLQKTYEPIRLQAGTLVRLSDGFIQMISGNNSITALAANTKIIVIQVGAFADVLANYTPYDEAAAIKEFKLLSHAFNYALSALSEEELTELFSYCSAYEGFDFWSRLSSIVHYDYDGHTLCENYENVKAFLSLFSDLFYKLGQVECITTGSSDKLFVQQETIPVENGGEPLLIKYELNRLSAPRSATSNVATTNASLRESLLKNIRNHFFLFQIPEFMRTGISKRVAASVAESLLLLKEKYPVRVIEEVIGGQGMQLKLCGEYFDITPVDNGTYLIKDGNIAKWNWDVTPLRSGKQKLTLSILSKRVIDDATSSLELLIEARTINVCVNTTYMVRQFIAKNWQWLIGICTGSAITIAVIKLLGIIS